MSINFLELEVSQVCPKIGKMEILYNIKQQLGLNYWGRMAFRRVVKKGLWPQHIIRASEEKKNRWVSFVSQQLYTIFQKWELLKWEQLDKYSSCNF